MLVRRSKERRKELQALLTLVTSKAVVMLCTSCSQSRLKIVSVVCTAAWRPVGQSRQPQRLTG